MTSLYGTAHRGFQWIITQVVRLNELGARRRLRTVHIV